MPPRAVLVVPCFNEALRLDGPAIASFLAAQDRVDLLFVNDGSTDGTVSLLEQIRLENAGRVTTLDLPFNGGKGEAVRRGVLKALEGAWDYIGYWDADLSTPLEASAEFLELLDTRPDIEWVFGARIRLLGRSVDRKASRHFTGRVFATAVSLMLGLPVYDTQCGAKLFRRTERTAAVFGRRFVSRWVFDVEVLARVIGQHPGYRIGRPFPVCEIPLREWHDVAGSKLSFAHMLGACVDLVRIGVQRRS